MFLENKKRFYIVIIFAIFFPYLFNSIKVSKSLNSDDIEITNLLNVRNQCSNINSYSDEIECINSIQKSQLKLIEDTNCRKGFINLGSKKVLEGNTACCFDRARITEQALLFYDFKIRHVFLIQTSKLGYFSLLIRNLPNHAVTEVLTSKGWLGVDSVESFILIDENKRPYSYSEGITNNLISKKTDNAFYQKPLIYIIGIYSRNGKFFKPYIPFLPEIEFVDFFKNVSSIKILSTS